MNDTILEQAALETYTPDMGMVYFVWVRTRGGEEPEWLWYIGQATSARSRFSDHRWIARHDGLEVVRFEFRHLPIEHLSSYERACIRLFQPPKNKKDGVGVAPTSVDEEWLLKMFADVPAEAVSDACRLTRSIPGIEIRDPNAEPVYYAPDAEYVPKYTPEAIRAVRRDHGLSQRDFAALIGTSQPFVCHLEAGRRISSQDLDARIDRAIRQTVRRGGLPKCVPRKSPSP